jgi:hypothetical protein
VHLRQALVVTAPRVATTRRAPAWRHAILAAAALSNPATAALAEPPPPPRVAQFPAPLAGLDRSQRADLARGAPVVRILESRHDRDIIVLGAISVAAPRVTYEARLLDFATSLGAPTRLKFGIFHDPATAADVADATVGRNDVAGARTCRPGKCQLKLPAADMTTLRSHIDWSPAANPSAQVNHYVQQRLVEYVGDYRVRGSAAMPVYDDVHGVRAQEAFDELLEQVSKAYADIPSLRRYFMNYPDSPLNGLGEVVFWATDSTPGMKSVLSLTHQIVYRPPEYAGVTLVAARKIYATHFFEAALDLTAIVDWPAPAGAPGSYIMMLRLARFDNLTAAVIFSVHDKVAARMRDQMLADLEREKVLALTARGDASSLSGRPW